MPKGDRMNATYRHEFFQEGLDLPFVGYSKLLGHDEAQNKEYLLEQYISRMLRNGYLDRSYALIFLTNTKQGNQYDNELVTITEAGYTLTNGAELMPHLDKMLKFFFHNRRNPDAPKQVTASRTRIGHQAKFWYDFEKKFRDKAELVEHIKLIKEKFGDKEQHVRCLGYYWKMIELQNLK